MKIDICITTYRNTEKLKICLKSIIEKTKFVDYKIYLWCNDPNEIVKKAIEDCVFVDSIKCTDKIIPIFNEDNSGSFSSNNNKCVAKGNGDYVLLLNDDCQPMNDDWLFSMSNILKTDEKVGIVGALLLYPDQKTIQHCGVFFSNKTNNLPYHMFYRQELSKVESYVKKPRYYQAVTGACLLTRRKDYETIGGLSEDFFYCYEDIGYCLDIKNKFKKQIVFNPRAFLIHHEGISKDGKNNPKLQDNIKTFKKKYTGTYFNDLEFYLSSPSHMLYKK